MVTGAVIRQYRPLVGQGWRPLEMGGSRGLRTRIQWSVRIRFSVTLTGGMWQPRQSSVTRFEEHSRAMPGSLP